MVLEHTCVNRSSIRIATFEMLGSLMMCCCEVSYEVWCVVEFLCKVCASELKLDNDKTSFVVQDLRGFLHRQMHKPINDRSWGLQYMPRASKVSN